MEQSFGHAPEKISDDKLSRLLRLIHVLRAGDAKISKLASKKRVSGVARLFVNK